MARSFRFRVKMTILPLENQCKMSKGASFYPPEMLYIDRKYPNEHLRYEKSTSHDIFSTFL